MRVGAHVSTAGGVGKAIDRAKEIGAEAIQVFCSSPQGWTFKPLSQEHTSAFRTRAFQEGIGPNFLHGIYLVNVGSQNRENLNKGIQSLINYMHVAQEIGAAGVIFHAGSHKGVGFDRILRQAVESMRRVLDNSPDDVWLIIENSAGMGHHVGAKFSEISRLIMELGDPRVKVCLDTQHCFAAGYDLSDKHALEAAMDEFDREIGFSNLVAVHANDSKVELGSGVDRHQNLGQGYIGLEGFEAIMAHRAFRDVPFLLEVPGFAGTGPDKTSVDILKSIRERIGLSG